MSHILHLISSPSIHSMLERILAQMALHQHVDEELKQLSGFLKSPPKQHKLQQYNTDRCIFLADEG